MALPMLLGGLGRLGLGAAMSPLQGLGFGFGYGYGVRLGYHTFKPSKSSTTTGLRLSPDPIQSSVGMGLGTAEERTGVALQSAPLEGLSQQPNPMPTPKKDEWIYSKKRGVPRIKKSQIKTHEEYVNYIKHGILPDGSGLGYQRKAMLYDKKRLNSRY